MGWCSSLGSMDRIWAKNCISLQLHSNWFVSWLFEVRPCSGFGRLPYLPNITYQFVCVSYLCHEPSGKVGRYTRQYWYWRRRLIFTTISIQKDKQGETDIWRFKIKQISFESLAPFMSKTRNTRRHHRFHIQDGCPHIVNHSAVQNNDTVLWVFRIALFFVIFVDVDLLPKV